MSVSPPYEARTTDLAKVVYPDSDGQPMADNTKQWEWIVLLKTNLDQIRDDFVAGDLLWYPVEGQPKIRIAPDVLVAPGRPKGHRGSYKQWEEGDTPPTVVFEVLSPSNTMAEMARKAAFYLRYGADEFAVVDPETEDGWVLVRAQDGNFGDPIALDGWQSPTLGIRFTRDEERLNVLRPDGQPFVAFGELSDRAEREAARAEREAARAEREAARAERLAAKLAALGVNLDEV